MKIDNSIAKMEEALEKKKALRASKDKAKLVTLESRIKVKAENITKLQGDLANTVTEMETVKARIQEESVVLNAKEETFAEIVNPPKPGPADETKSKTFGPDKSESSSDKKTTPRKR